MNKPTEIYGSAGAVEFVCRNPNGTYRFGAHVAPPLLRSPPASFQVSRAPPSRRRIFTSILTSDRCSYAASAQLYLEGSSRSIAFPARQGQRCRILPPPAAASPLLAATSKSWQEGPGLVRSLEPASADRLLAPFLTCVQWPTFCCSKKDFSTAILVRALGQDFCLPLPRCLTASSNDPSTPHRQWGSCVQSAER